MGNGSTAVNDKSSPSSTSTVPQHKPIAKPANGETKGLIYQLNSGVRHISPVRPIIKIPTQKPTFQKMAHNFRVTAIIGSPADKSVSTISLLTPDGLVGSSSVVAGCHEFNLISLSLCRL